jgi:CRISPR-associated endonuclease/helicase Cas3
MTGGKIKRSIEYDMSTLYERLLNYISKFNNPDHDINKKRNEILNCCLKKAINPKWLYTLTVPTGGGKTISSLAFALRHAVEHEMDRIIYVIPYTSIIEQNASVFKKIVGSEYVLEHHSNYNLRR